MDLDLIVCRNLSVEEAHNIADILEAKIKQGINGADVTIHIEPCLKEECPGMNTCTSEKTRLE